jgi:hypothetical protein
MIQVHSFADHRLATSKYVQIQPGQAFVVLENADDIEFMRTVLRRALNSICSHFVGEERVRVENLKTQLEVRYEDPA